MNQPITITPGDGPLTVYVVALEYRPLTALEYDRDRVPYDDRPTRSRLLSIQMTVPGIGLYSDPGIEAEADELIRSKWPTVEPGTNPNHYRTGLGTVNTTYVYPQPAKRRIKK